MDLSIWSPVAPDGALSLHPSALLPSRISSYTTRLGVAYCADSLEVLALLPSCSVNLVITSPPYALEFKKEYGNAAKAQYVDWLRPFAREILRVLTDDGSFVINIGGSYNAGTPTRSLYHFRALLMLCDEVGFRLAQECFWHNPAKLPAPAEWVTVRRQRIKDAVEYVWWLSKSDWPKADNRRVLVDYSPDMKRLIERGYRSKRRPSGHMITPKFQRDHGGAIPSNLIDRGNNESNSAYVRACAAHGFKVHPARFPSALPEFFIRLLTEPRDVVLDPFSGSNTTGHVAEGLERRWISVERDSTYVESSRLRFSEPPAQAAS